MYEELQFFVLVFLSRACHGWRRLTGAGCCETLCVFVSWSNAVSCGARQTMKIVDLRDAQSSLVTRGAYTPTPVLRRLQRRFDRRSTHIRLQFERDATTTYATTVGLPCCGLLHCGLNK